jgi:hypothetical protein
MAQQYTVSNHTPGEAPRPAGKVFIDDDGTVMVLVATPDSEDLLEAAVATINESETVSLRLPPADDATRFARRAREVERAEEDFPAAVVDTLWRSFGLKLEPVA